MGNAGDVPEIRLSPSLSSCLFRSINKGTKNGATLPASPATLPASRRSHFAAS